MIFISKNEKGEPAWKMVLDGRKTVTRRLKPLPVGKDFAVQPGRGKFSVCRCKVLSCINHKEWLLSQGGNGKLTIIGMPFFTNEAKKEGFEHWHALLKFLAEKGLVIDNLYRIEFKKIGS